jgi:hypothetical protein
MMHGAGSEVVLLEDGLGRDGPATQTACSLLETSKRVRATHVIYYAIKTYIMNFISHLACFFIKPLMPNVVSTLES